MKNLLLLLLIAFSSFIYGQAPDQINYQGVARNAVGNVLPNKKITIRLSIREGNGNGTILYSETRKITTNSFGLFNLAIGGPGADNSTGSISGIDWASDKKFIQVEIDPNGATSFINMGAAQLLSVPYALYAGTAGTGVLSGTAGGVLTGTYPNPSIANGAITQSMIAAGVIPASLPPNGTAGGDLTGSYPNPTINTNAITTAKLANLAVTTPKLADGSVTSIKLAAGVIPASLPPNGTAGGDLTGSYPDPTINNNAITTSKLANLSVTTPKLADGSVTSIKLAAGIIPTSLPPNGTAGGDLTGSYPNPTINVNAINTTKLADLSVTTPKLADGSVTSVKLAAGIIPTSLPPNGTAGGDLTGSYPNPTINASTITTTKLADGSVTSIKLAAGVIPTSLPPNGAAGGDLTGSYPNPTINTNAITTTKLANLSVTTPKLADGSVTSIKLAAGVIPTSLPPNGAAGGDLTGSYPNPTINTSAITTTKLADNSVTTAKIVDASVTSAKLAAGISLPPNGAAGGDLSGSYPNPLIGKLQSVSLSSTIPTTGQVLKFNGTQWAPGTDNAGSGGGPTGPAGGDLSGTYPDPLIGALAVTNSKLANGAVNTPKLADLSVTTIKLADGAVTSVKLAAGVIPTSLPPSGGAGGDLTGTYPNPTVNTGAITTAKLADGSVTNIKLADNSVTTTKIADASVTSAKLAAGISLPPNGAAGGDLTGTYPNPTINTNAITTTKILDLAVTTPKLADGSVTNIKLADNSVTTTKIADASVTSAKLAAGISLPPNGAAGGDLSGSYPNPSVNKIQGVIVNNTAPANGQVLKFNGTQWAPGTDNSGGITLPFTNTISNAQNLISLTNTGTGAGLEGINSSNNANAFGVIGKITSAAPGSSSAGIRGINSGIGSNGAGVWGTHSGAGDAVYGNSQSGTGVHGSSVDGTGVYGTSTNYVAGMFDIADGSNANPVVYATTIGSGAGVMGTSDYGHGLYGATNSDAAAGVIGWNFGGGEAVVGKNFSSTSGAVVGKNDGTYAGVVGISGSDNGIGILARANVDGTLGSNALVASIEGSGAGNPAVFMANGVNVARIDETGKGYFNNGTVNSGADVAEAFDITGSRNEYEAGDVLVISTDKDRTVEKSSEPYSTLVAGVYATKPGVLLTEENIGSDLTGKVPMGVIGVIPTKVCLEGGAIKRGDLLVTSSLPGVAMKADMNKVKIGQVIGKALQDYDNTVPAKIKVLVSIK